jgi:uncharacterized membrane protein YcaP (DUF421 family)
MMFYGKFKRRFFRKAAADGPKKLVDYRKVVGKELDREMTTLYDLRESLSVKDIDDLSKVRKGAYLETDGSISVLPYEDRRCISWWCTRIRKESRAYRGKFYLPGMCQ